MIDPSEAHQGGALSFSLGVARVLSLAEVREFEEWQHAFAGKCKDHRFYEIVERTLDSKFEHHYLLLEDQSGKVRAIQPVFFVQQNLVEGIPALRGAVDAIRRRFPRFLTMRVLMVGNAAGEGHLSACAPEDEDWVANALHATLKTYARLSKASLVVFKDFPAKYRRALRNFSANGYTRVPSMPMTELRLRYTDFDQYLGTLGASTRKDLRRKFRKTAAAPPIALEVVTDLTPSVDEVYPLYLQVHERSEVRMPDQRVSLPPGPTNAGADAVFHLAPEWKGHCL
jgi:predicted N-acyltransferase